MTAQIKLEREAHIAKLTISNPPANTWTLESLNQLKELATELSNDRSIYALVLTGEGEKFFSAGADLNNFASGDKSQAADMALAFGEAFEALSAFDGVSIAAINGYAMGGGLEVAMACDIAIAGDEAVFGLPEINWGHVPGGAASLKTIEFMGYRKALYYAMTGVGLNSKKAEEEGLITRSVAQTELLNEVTVLARLLAEKSPPALKTVKEIYRNASRMTIEQTHEFVNAKVDQLRLKDSDGLRHQGMNDFINKQLRTT